jgi:hypothetical protein
MTSTMGLFKSPAQMIEKHMNWFRMNMGQIQDHIVPLKRQQTLSTAGATLFLSYSSFMISWHAEQQNHPKKRVKSKNGSSGFRVYQKTSWVLESDKIGARAF